MGVKAGAQTADMRETIANQVLNWIDGARWEDPQRAERVAWKLAEAPERYVSPNPGEHVTWNEEASRIYKELKAEYGLRTVSEARAEAGDYDDRARRHAVDALREQGEAVADDVAEEFGWSFVVDVLGYDPRDLRPSIEEQAAAVVDDFEISSGDDVDDEPTLEEQAAELVEELEAEDEPSIEEQAAKYVRELEAEPELETEPELLELELEPVNVSIGSTTSAVIPDAEVISDLSDAGATGKPPPEKVLC